MAFNEETKNHKSHNDRERQARRGAMFEEPGNALCPVASFEAYLSRLPESAKAFYHHPRKSVSPTDTVWYSLEPLGVNTLGSMMSRISEEAGTAVRYTNHCVRSTCIQRLAEAGLEAREIMAVSGHRNESSLRSYWAPSLENRKIWSSALFAGPKPAQKRALDDTTPTPIAPKKPFTPLETSSQVNTMNFSSRSYM